MKEEPQPLDYARPPEPPPDVSNLPAYERYSAAQLVVRCVLALLIAATMFLIIPGILMAIFTWAWR